MLRSPLARAVLPVLGGAAVIGLIFGVTWLIAVSKGDESSEALARSTFPVGPVDAVADTVAEDGPIVFADLNTTAGNLTLVLDHEGDDPTRGWQLYLAYPADRGPECEIEQVRGTSTFVDCDGRRIDVTELSPPPGAHPRVEDQRDLVLDLTEATRLG